MSAPSIAEIVRTTLSCRGDTATGEWIADTVDTAKRLARRRRAEALVLDYLEGRFRALKGDLHS